MAVLLPIWSTKRETARRVRQGIGAGVRIPDAYRLSAGRGPRGARDGVGHTVATWTVPPEHMKARLEHQMPFSGHAVSVLRRARELSSIGVATCSSDTGN